MQIFNIKVNIRKEKWCKYRALKQSDLKGRAVREK